MDIKRTLALWFMVVLSFVVVASAVEAGEQEEGPAQPQLRQKARKLMQTMMMWKLVEELDLDEKECAVLFPKINQHNQAIQEIQKKEREVIRSLKDVLKSDEPSSEKIDGAIANLREIKEQKTRQETAFEKTLQDTLSKEQFARYIVLRQDFRKEVQGFIKNAHQRRRGQRQSDDEHGMETGKRTQRWMEEE